MGKRKIGEIYNKPIIEGDINLKTPYEIHKSELAPQNGGGSGEGGGSNIEYFAFDSSNIPIVVMATASQLLKARTQSPDGTLSMIAAGPNMYVFEQLQTTGPEKLAIGVDLNTKFAVKKLDGSSEMFALLDVLLENFTKEDIVAIPRITEEEFYNLNA